MSLICKTANGRQIIKDNPHLLCDEYLSLLTNDEMTEEMISNIVNDHNLQEVLRDLQACSGYNIISKLGAAFSYRP